jgi:hypothetical protein
VVHDALTDRGLGAGAAPRRRHGKSPSLDVDNARQAAGAAGPRLNPGSMQPRPAARAGPLRSRRAQPGRWLALSASGRVGALRWNTMLVGFHKSCVCVLWP